MVINISISAGEQLPGTLDVLATAMRAKEYAAAHPGTATVAGLLYVDTYCPIVGAKRPLFTALLALPRGDWRGTGANKDAFMVLFGIALYPLNRAALVELVALRALFTHVMTDGPRSWRMPQPWSDRWCAVPRAWPRSRGVRAPSWTSWDPATRGGAAQRRHGQWQTGGLRVGEEGTRRSAMVDVKTPD